MATESKPPKEVGIAAAYQVTARWFTNEQQLIWRRTALFVTLNSLVIAAVQFLPSIHPTLRILVPFVGAAYSICWHFSMKRAWAYQTFLMRMLREHEGALNLGPLGAFTRVVKVMEGGIGETIAGEHTSIPRRHVMFRAKLLSDATTWLFVAVYVVFLIHGASEFKTC